ncbi:MAG TPA: prepilin-type N-terminal cleavage/methylation domain-containing protein [Acidiferrobacterales bacterium]|jgi:prepilin-type N-terminal cleavage/methylation domain-containing protein
MRRAAIKGFTLIELVLVIVVVSVGMLTLLGLYGQVAGKLGTNEDIQIATQLAQECSEHILATRRNLGFTAPTLTNAICNGLPAVPAGFTRGVTIGANYVGGLATACPNGATCRDVSVTISQGLATRAQVVFLLVQY